MIGTFAVLLCGISLLFPDFTYAAEKGDLTSAQQLESTIRNGISNNLSKYRLTPGDTVEVLFHFSGQPESNQYFIAIGDQLDINFVYHSSLNRSVMVRPDGRITLPRRGDIMASGLTPTELSQKITEQYAELLKRPIVNVDVKKFQFHSQEIRDVNDLTQRGQSKRTLISPDGRIALPLLSPILAAGKTIEQVTDEINNIYQESFHNLRVSLMLDNLAGNRVFVFGEIRTPGPIVMNGPMTVLQAVAQAGGPLDTGSLEEVRVVSADPSGQPRIRTVNLADIGDQDALSEDQWLPANATIYLPPTAIARAGRNVDQIIRRIFMFTGIGVGFNYGKTSIK
jgi:protein involved in polysaccharide export with SLBB domain